MGVKGAEKWNQVRGERRGPNRGTAMATVSEEKRSERRHYWRRGVMRSYQEDQRRRRRTAGLRMTLRLESVGSQQEKIR